MHMYMCNADLAHAQVLMMEMASLMEVLIITIICKFDVSPLMKNLIRLSYIWKSCMHKLLLSTAFAAIKPIFLLVQIEGNLFIPQ